MSQEDDRRPEGEGFLTRWSRRKRDETLKPPAVAAPELPEAETSANTTTEIEVPPFDVSLLPDIESLTAESDISAFLQRGVPEALKNAALRRIWSADPAIRDFIGPVDYQWDFNDPAGVPGFGPLGSDVDVEALLRQVIGGSEPRIEPETEEEQTVHLAEADPGDQDVRTADEPPINDNSTPGESLSSAEHAFTQENDAMRANILQKSHSPEEVSLKVRRHGSALPT